MKRKDAKYKYINVMLINDNELENFLNEKMLEANLFSKNIYVHNNAKSALEFLSKRPTMNDGEVFNHPEVIFVEINMPVMSGIDFIKHYNQIFKNKVKSPKIVLLTASVYDTDIEKAKALLKDIIFLNKPLNQDMLTQI